MSQKYKKQKLRCDSYQLLMGVRNEFEHDLIDMLYPRGFPNIEDRYLRCMIVTNMQTGPMVEKYRSIIKEAKFTTHEFCYIAETEVYHEKSKIAHKIQILDYCLSIENFTIEDDKELKDYISKGHRRGDTIDTILRLRQERLNYTGSLGTVDLPENSVRCVLEMFHFVKDSTKPEKRYLPTKQIQSVFQAREAKDNMLTICEIEKSNAEKGNTGTVFVEFFKPRHTVMALIEYQDKVNDYGITVNMTDCDQWKCSAEQKWTTAPKTTQQPTTERTTTQQPKTASQKLE